ncbi:trigger factor [Anoxynatronum buryatiense]|uniref:Trigger factor n=1 Tax=Anoxynatronum buryatiense TaxID=489973 RepID=A0AA45WWT5_9CLOT|nr:trigger factor [Anoxynatronum buryatiense]SMP61384.1 trigger factor [Anoxynatronum buryatiense]
MSSEIIKQEENQISLRITVSPEKFEEAVNKAYHKMRSRFNIPGFRKGKAPRKIVELNYGPEIFYEEAINFAFPDAYEAALEDLDLDPVDHPQVDIEQMEKGKEVIFIADIEVMPEILVEGYKGVEVEKVLYTSDEASIEAELKGMQEKNARMITIDDRPVKEGDQVQLDYEGSVEGELFEGGKAEGHTLEIGSGRFIPGFEEQLVGLSTGDEAAITVTFPEEYHAEELAGKEAVFKVKINEIKEKEVPELDDEFAKDVSEFDTLEDLRSDLLSKQETAAKEREEQELRNAVVKAVADKVAVNMPDAVIDRQVDRMMQDFGYQMSSQGLGMEMYYQITGSSEEDLRERMRSDAERQVKEQLVLEKITEMENITADEAEIDEEIARVAGQYGQEVEKFRETAAKHDTKIFADNVILRKTIDFLVENATIKEKAAEAPVETEEETAE